MFRNWSNLQEMKVEITMAKARGPVCETVTQFRQRIALMQKTLEQQRGVRKAQRARTASAIRAEKREKAKRRRMVKRIRELRRGKATNGPSAPAA